MASSFQQKSRLRKFSYAGLIIVLLTGSMLLRKGIVEPRAYDLQLRAEAQGEVELTSSAVRLTLFGSRGLATCVLWQMAIEKQKRHQWNEVELLVKSVTKLQPNFVTPWLFQSWNLAYNVAVECDRTRDKYFYISRGIQLLAEGERRHQGTQNIVSQEDRKKFPGNPEMRFYMGLFYQMKIGNSDEKNAMRCLFDLSCTDPREWDPDTFWVIDEKGKTINWKKFEDFCRRHPRLVRRLREKLYCSEPKDVLAFLKKNRDIPSRFQEAVFAAGPAGQKTPLADPIQQFPILPPPYRADMPDPAKDRFDDQFQDDFDVFLAAHWWYVYAQEPLPEYPAVPYMGVREPNYQDLEYRIKYRFPKMMLELFRAYPARSLEYYAENREQFEGWFDGDGWEIEEWFENVPDVNTPVRVGQETKYSASPAWKKAFDTYENYGLKTGLLLSPEKRQQLTDLAERYYRKKYKVSDLSPPEPLSDIQRADNNGLMGESYDAHTKLFWNNQMRSLTNFDSHYEFCRVERLEEVVDARKLLFYANKLKAKFDVSATEEFKKGLMDWLEILVKYPKYQSLNEIQVETYENQWKYLELLQDDQKKNLIQIIRGTMQFGKMNPMLASIPTNIPFFDLNQDQENKLVPMRNVGGFLEWIYVLKEPERRDQQEALVYLSSMFIVPPKLPLELFKPNLLILITNRDPLAIEKQWRPLIEPENVVQGRSNLRLDRKALPPELKQATSPVQ